MRKWTWTGVLAVLLVATTAQAEGRLEGNQARTGFAAEVHLGTSLFSLGQGNGAFNTVQGGFFLGGKIHRVIVGLGFDIERMAAGQGQTGQSDTTTARTSIQFTPGVRVALLRSRDQKVELFGEVDLGLGHTFLSPSPDNGTDTSNFHLTYTLGPGLRYWVHPQLALSALAALNGQFEFDSTHVSGSTITTTTSTGLTNIVAALQVTGIF